MPMFVCEKCLSQVAQGSATEPCGVCNLIGHLKPSLEYWAAKIGKTVCETNHIGSSLHKLNAVHPGNTCGYGEDTGLELDHKQGRFISPAKRCKVVEDDYSSATKADFEEAVKRLIGAEKYESLRRSGFSYHDFCREIAQDTFINALGNSPTKEGDLGLIRHVAKRLWRVDGVTGMLD